MKQAVFFEFLGFRRISRSRLGAQVSVMVFGAVMLSSLLAPRVFSAETSGAGAAGSGHHCLWRIDGPHCAVYLLGSIHFLKPDNYPLAAPIEGAFARSDLVLFETDIGQMQEPATQQKALAQSMLPAGQTLQGQLSPATFVLFSNHVAEAGMPLMVFAQLKPAMAAMTLELLEVQKLGFDASEGLDMHFYKLAREKKKTIIPLETVDFQLGLLTGFSKEENELMMKSTLEQIDDTKKMLGEMIQSWQTGDPAGMAKLLNPMEKDAPAIFKRLVTDRSHQWVTKVQELVRGDKTALVVVGAGHLVGREGLVELLRAAGCKLVQE